MSVSVIISILVLAAKYGIPAIQQAIEELGKDEITEADIDHLEALVRPPESYFEDED
ncbi:MAG: hypothetical protein AB7D47_13130 [Desulfovibrio sp.]